MCYSPIVIKTPQGHRTVPCGHCLECLAKRQQDWSNRMYEELKAYDGKAVFFTLTYSENNVPKNYLKYGRNEEGEATYELLRSPSDYGYDNCFTDERGNVRVLPSCRGERKHPARAPYEEVLSRYPSLDVNHILDFNLKRDNHKEFIKRVKKIYGEFVEHILERTPGTPGDSRSSDIVPFDFDTYDGDLFNFEASMDPSSQFLCETLGEVIDDDEYLKTDDNPILLDRLEERPVMQFNSVRKKDVQDWLKRGRERLKRKGLNFSYFITSEYGPRTLRPHYHGILFGVSAQDANIMKLDWQKHFGERISWEDVDLSKGDLSYCAKYCAKAFFEHPLCSRDFFYSKAVKAADGVQVLPFTEYHSKHYERCIELFGVDEPIVDKSFIIVSKGLGAAWIDTNKDLVGDFNDWFAFDYGDDDVVSVRREIAPWEDDYTTYRMKGYEPNEAGFIEADMPVERLNNKTLKPKKYEECITRLFDRYHYYRQYKKGVYAYGVPKYYRTKMFNDGLRCAFANYLSSVNAEVYREKLDALRAGNPAWSVAEAVLELEAQEREKHCTLASKLYKKMEKTYNKSKI